MTMIVNLGRVNLPTFSGVLWIYGLPYLYLYGDGSLIVFINQTNVFIAPGLALLPTPIKVANALSLDK